MEVWNKSRKKSIFTLLVFVSIEKIYQTLETLCHRLSKHLEFRQTTPLRVVFSTLFSMLRYPNETLSLVFDILTGTTSRLILKQLDYSLQLSTHDS